MSSILQYMSNQGVPENTIILILMLPIIATIIVFARQVIGIKAFGIYTSLIITFAFLITGLSYGLIFFILILAVGTLFRFLVRKIRLLYLPRMGIVLTAVALSILAIFFVGSYYHQTNLLSIPIFPILIVITLVEKFVTAQIERGDRIAIVLTLETLVLAIVCYYMANWNFLQNLILSYPEYVLLTVILINFGLGRWTGLRLFEYFRFKEVIKHIELPYKK